jgi:putative DNA primase/helicase
MNPDAAARQRFTRRAVCPVCSGSADDPRHQAKRCHGYIAGQWIHCSREEHSQGCRFGADQTYAHRRSGKCPCGVEHAPAARPERKQIDRVHKYHDRDGRVAYEVVRYKNPKDFKQRRTVDGKVVWSLGDTRRVLYHLPTLLAAPREQVVWIPEGEKHVEELGTRGLLATCNSEGAGKWRDYLSEDLVGRTCCILPDNDEPGRRHAAQVARSLSGKARSVKVVDLTAIMADLPQRGDVLDFLARGGTIAQIEDLAARTAQWNPDDDHADAPAAAQPERAVNEAPDDPHRLARLYAASSVRLAYWQGEFSSWERAAYRGLPDCQLSAAMASVMKKEFDTLNRREIFDWETRGEVNGQGRQVPQPQARKVSRQLVGNSTLALSGLCLIDRLVDQPAWLCDQPPFPAIGVLPTANALVHLPSFVAGDAAAIQPPTPDFFCSYALEFEFKPTAPPPESWLAFLASVWPNDPQSIESLQDWMGYLLTPDTRQQKIALLIGPPRSGRGTIARVIKALIGPENVAAPAISALARDFGAAPLIGKPVAIIGDARISGRADSAAVVERILAISGEDQVTIERKYLPSWTGKLPTRLMLLANELPRLPDHAGALAARFLVFQFRESFEGREDLELDARLQAELPGILMWAVAGWARLHDRRRFVQPESAKALLAEFRDLASPVGAFVRDRCLVEVGRQIRCSELFDAWKNWCAERNREPGSEQIFGRNLRAVVATLDVTQPRIDGKQVRHYEGLDLRLDLPAF